MTYVDTTLTPAVTYTYVHNGQIYDQIATTLAAQGAWEYVEYVDAINGANTYRRHIWRCKSAGSGLPNDFYVMFQTKFTTATGIYATDVPINILLAEGYSAGVLSKMASNNLSVTLASDLTNPATWALTTYATPSNIPSTKTIGPSSTLTSVRLLYCVAKDAIFSNWGGVIGQVTYVGAYDTTLGAVADPMPLVIFTGNNDVGNSTRAPLQTAGAAVTDVFSTVNYWNPVSGGVSIGVASPWQISLRGILGTPSNTDWPKSHGGVQVARCYLSSYVSNQNLSSAKGFVRGYFKYMRTANLAAHSVGDTFLVDGKAYLGLGAVANGLWDTTAA